MNVYTGSLRVHVTYLLVGCGQDNREGVIGIDVRIALPTQASQAHPYRHLCIVGALGYPPCRGACKPVALFHVHLLTDG